MNSFDEGSRKRARQDHGFLRIFTQPGLREVRFRILKEQTLAGLWAVRCVAPGVLIEKEVIDKVEPYRFWNRYPATWCLQALCKDRCQLESPALYADLLARFTSYLSTVPNNSTENGWKHVKASLVGGLAVCAACPLAIQTITHIPGDGDSLEIIRSRVQTKVQEDLSSYGFDREKCTCLPHGKLPWLWDMLRFDGLDGNCVDMQRKLVRCAPLSYVYWWRARVNRQRITMKEMYGEALVRHRAQTLVALWGDMIRAEQASISSSWAWGKFFDGDSIFYDVRVETGEVETLVQHMVRTHGLPHRRTWLHCLRNELVEPEEDLNDEPTKTRAIFLRHVMPLYDRTNRKHAAQIRFVIASALGGDEWTDMFFRWAADHRDALVAATPEWLADLPPTAREVWRRNIGE